MDIVLGVVATAKRRRLRLSKHVLSLVEGARRRSFSSRTSLQVESLNERLLPNWHRNLVHSYQKDFMNNGVMGFALG